ncbi:hypothetical protein AMECASPLE_005759 [Ameca splendens]|uniref:Uncharacterized protein n=1 Tax=Ameca splendens TaxID=208324 RepID=A0ABV1A5H2_9TELE
MNKNIAVLVYYKHESGWTAENQTFSPTCKQMEGNSRHCVHHRKLSVPEEDVFINICVVFENLYELDRAFYMLGSFRKGDKKQRTSNCLHLINLHGGAFSFRKKNSCCPDQDQSRREIYFLNQFVL